MEKLPLCQPQVLALEGTMTIACKHRKEVEMLWSGVSLEGWAELSTRSWLIGKLDMCRGRPKRAQWELKAKGAWRSSCNSTLPKRHADGCWSGRRPRSLQWRSTNTLELLGGSSYADIGVILGKSSWKKWAETLRFGENRLWIEARKRN